MLKLLKLMEEYFPRVGHKGLTMDSSSTNSQELADHYVWVEKSWLHCSLHAPYAYLCPNNLLILLLYLFTIIFRNTQNTLVFMFLCLVQCSSTPTCQKACQRWLFTQFQYFCIKQIWHKEKHLLLHFIFLLTDNCPLTSGKNYNIFSSLTRNSSIQPGKASLIFLP